LNNLEDITLYEDFSTVCGITQQELESNFQEHLDVAADKLGRTKAELLDDIRLWYDGYSWDGQTFVYNPFSTLLCLKQKIIKNFWFETGTPTFLIELVKQRNGLENILQPIVTNSDSFKSFDPDNLTEIPLLFQTGYLTVKKTEQSPDVLIYTLDFPNREVKQSMLTWLVSSYSGYDRELLYQLRQGMLSQIRACDAAGFEQSLRKLLSRIPYQLHLKYEAYYHSLIHAWAMLMGIDVQSEVSTNTGRIDAVWHLPDATVITEVKYGATKKTDALLKDAISPIHDRRYYEKYWGNGKRILLMGLAFSGKGKNVGCKIEELSL
jgi:hypothetical protein